MRLRSKQLELPLPTGRGGKRTGAGRKATGKFGRDPKGIARPGVSHRARPTVKARIPMHVTVRTRYAPRSLRNFAVAAEIGGVLKRRAARGLQCRVVHFTILRDHLHLVVEAEDGNALARGMQGLLSGGHGSSTGRPAARARSGTTDTTCGGWRRRARCATAWST